MAGWSPENATKAYLQALRMGKRGKEPDAAEFISALAAGSNAQLIVVACAGTAGPAALALIAAAHQTGGRVACIVKEVRELLTLKAALGPYVDRAELRVGDARMLLLGEYKLADFVLIDCEAGGCEGVFGAAQEGGRGALVVGYNALHKGSWRNPVRAEVLPIGEGLVVARPGAANGKISKGNNRINRSRWIVEVDKWTGEEHFYRIGLPKRRVFEA